MSGGFSALWDTRRSNTEYQSLNQPHFEKQKSDLSKSCDYIMAEECADMQSDTSNVLCSAVRSVIQLYSPATAASERFQSANAVLVFAVSQQKWFLLAVFEKLHGESKCFFFFFFLLLGHRFKLLLIPHFTAGLNVNLWAAFTTFCTISSAGREIEIYLQLLMVLTSWDRMYH